MRPISLKKICKCSKCTFLTGILLLDNEIHFILGLLYKLSQNQFDLRIHVYFSHCKDILLWHMKNCIITVQNALVKRPLFCLENVLQWFSTMSILLSKVFATMLCGFAWQLRSMKIFTPKINNFTVLKNQQKSLILKRKKSLLLENVAMQLPNCTKKCPKYSNETFFL